MELVTRVLLMARAPQFPQLSNFGLTPSFRVTPSFRLEQCDICIIGLVND